MSASKFNKLAGARVLVLGGTSGIGFSVAEGAIEYGASVVVASSNAEKVEQAVSRLQKAYPDRAASVSGHACDLYDTAKVEANLTTLFKFATADGKKIDHVVNTAGGPGRTPPLAELQPSDTEGGSKRMAGILMVAKLAPHYMEPGPQSSLAYTTGTLLYKPMVAMATAIGWAGAVEATMRGLAIALAPLRVNVVAPGAIDTELLQGYGGGNEEAREAAYKRFRDTNLLNLVGRPEDTAEAYLYLMKDRFITGQTILTDGGRLLHEK